MPKNSIDAIKQYENKKGEKRWRFKKYLGINPTTGKRVNVSRSGFKSISEARSVYKMLIVPEQSRDSGDTTTLDELFEMWFDTYCGDVKESTALKTKEMYRLHISPKFGAVYLSEITRPMIQRYVNLLPKKLVKYRLCINYFNRLLKYAVTLDYIDENPMTKIMIPRKSPRPRRDTSANFYSKDELTEFLTAAKASGMRNYVYFSLLATSGLRRSEALALTWRDIDMNKREIRVNKTLTNNLEGELVVGPPKTIKSIRNVPLNTDLIHILKVYRFSQPAGFRKIFSTYEDNYVSLAKPRQWLTQVYKKLPDDFKRISVHGFRHTFASLMFESNPNITPKDIQTMLGHETIEMSMNVYTHMTDDGKERLEDAVDTIKLSSNL